MGTLVSSGKGKVKMFFSKILLNLYECNEKEFTKMTTKLLSIKIIKYSTFNRNIF